MTSALKVVSIVGARPQFVKVAPVARAFARHEGVDHRIAHTGQHYDHGMSEVFFEELEIPHPDINLDAGSGSHAAQTATMMTRLDDYIEELQPDLMLVYGDTNSTIAASLVAAKRTLPTAHIEAGLRSFDRSMPEEINRIVADHCSDRLYVPTPEGMTNLANEGLTERAVLTGDVMLDVVTRNIKIAEEKSAALSENSLETGQYGLVTLHRAANATSETIRPLLDELEAVANQQLPLLFAVHPRTRKLMDEIGYEPPETLTLTGPLPYLDTILLVANARVVITDSGGVQKEAAFLNTPCLTMRNETEWVETLSIGVNRLVGDRGETLQSAVSDLLSGGEIFTDTVRAQLAEHYGEGKAAELIADDCIEWMRGA